MFNRLGLGVTFSLFVAFVGTTFAQRPLIRGHVFLPRTNGATVLSTYIDAEARRMVAVGDLVESMAVARSINVQSDREAMKNSVLWVETYFKRKELNRQARRAQDPIYIDQQQERDDMKKRAVLQQPEEALNGDVTDDLNWLLDRLVTDQSTYQFIHFDRDGEATEVDRPLADESVSHIRLREATGELGGGQSVDASTGDLFPSTWPTVLRSPDFEGERLAFEVARDKVLRELEFGPVSFEAWRSLQSANDHLTHKFNVVYSRDALKDADGDDRILMRTTALDHLQSLEAAIARAFTADNRDSFDEHYLFTGDSLIALVRHCADNGLEFASPQPDDKATYRTLFLDLRQVYLHFHPSEVSE